MAEPPAAIIKYKKARTSAKEKLARIQSLRGRTALTMWAVSWRNLKFPPLGG
ncbi:MAG: hypothetical protein QNJ38_10805 [Prochloraceae cyanobacterium]|nr:hypothetical protein [Prochloraceae cyanobacterium]